MPLQAQLRLQPNQRKQRGFTFIELIMVLGIMTVMISVIVVNLLRPQQQASLDTTVSTVMTDIKSQQHKAMAGESDGASTAQEYGVHFNTGSYTLFRGTTYSPSDANNFTVALSSELQITTSTLLGAELHFSRISGEVFGYDSTHNKLSFKNTSNNEQKTMTINQYGVMVIN